jgi:hypothetical protein
MTSREAITEIRDILEIDNTLVADSLYVGNQLDRLKFLFTYIDTGLGKLPADPDFDALQRSGICL